MGSHQTLGDQTEVFLSALVMGTFLIEESHSGTLLWGKNANHPTNVGQIIRIIIFLFIYYSNFVI